MFAEPLATAVTTPEASTEATAALLEDQVTALLVALAGLTVAVRACVEPPTVIAFVEPLTDTPVAATVTVILIDPYFVLFASDVARMLTVPGPTAVTTPDASTVAIALLALVQVTVLFGAIDGSTVALSWSVALVLILVIPPADVTVTPVTATIGDRILNPEYEPTAIALSFDVAVIDNPEPAPTNVTTPDASIVASEESFVDQVIVLSDAFAGNTVADICRV